MRKSEPDSSYWPAAERAAFIAAIGSAGGTFAPGMLPRSGIDQSVATGLVTAVNYAVVAAGQSFAAELGAVAAAVFELPGGRGWRYAPNLLGIGVGVIASQIAARPTLPSMLRPVGLRMARSCTLGLVATAANNAAGNPRWWSPAGRPAAIVLGATITATAAFRQRRSEGVGSTSPLADPRAAGRSVCVGAGLSVVLVAAGHFEHLVVERLAKAADRRLPANGIGRAAGLISARGLVLWSVTAVARSYLHRAALSVQATNARVDHAYQEAPAGVTVSGGPASRVDYETLGQEGSRFVQALVTRDRIAAISGVVGPVPVRAYVGLTSAATPRARVDMAVAELERLGGFDRRILCVAVPAGSGYVNPVAIGALEHLANGDCATVALQYSLRRSYQSMNRVPLSVSQNKLLLTALGDRVRDLPPDRRPTVLLYGESLGALAGQGAFDADGVAALDQAGIDLALFAGTPSTSSWARRWRATPRIVDPDGQIVEIAGIGDWSVLPSANRVGVRSVLLTHHDDPVTVFDRGLLVRPARARAWASVPYVDPVKFRPLTTFTLTALDLKNAMNDDPSIFGTAGHDYRGDLVRVLAATYRFDVNETELVRIEQSLREAETGALQRTENSRQRSTG